MNNLKNKMSGVVVKIISKGVGRTIGSQPFNPTTSSCDVMHNGKACCVNPKEAQKYKMPYCGPPKKQGS